MDKTKQTYNGTNFIQYFAKKKIRQFKRKRNRQKIF